MTLVETIISLALLIVSGVAGVYSFMLLNRYAARERYITEAKALCQERIEQVLTLLYTPPGTLPTVTGQNGTLYSILGTSTNYTSAGVYTAAESFQEPVTLYLAQDPTSASTVTGTRTTLVTPANMIDSSGTGLVLPMVQFTVTVAWVANGENHSYSMYTMRASN